MQIPANKLRVIILVSYLVIIAVIPTAAFFLSQSFNSASSASAPKPSFKPIIRLDASDSSILDQEAAGGEEVPPEEAATTEPSPSPPIGSSDEALVVSGPTMSFAIVAEGRPPGDQTNKMFVGVSQGATSSGTPSYLVSVTVDVPTSGVLKNFSLAGLTPGITYSAYLKGQAQIATSSAFLMRAGDTPVNNGFALSLTTGDVNDDNIINQADYDIIRAYFGTTRASVNWNPILDFNSDGIVNGFELGMISKNMAKVGSSGVIVTSSVGN